MSEGITAEGALLQVNTGTTASPTWVPIVERAQLRVAKTTNVITMTSFDDEGFEGTKPGIRSSGIEASGNYVPSDTGYQYLEDMYLDGAQAEFRALWVTSAPGVTPVTYRGWRVECTLTDLSESGNVGDKVELGLSLRGNGRPSVVTV